MQYMYKKFHFEEKMDPNVIKNTDPHPLVLTVHFFINSLLI